MKQRAIESEFPLLAANIVNSNTGEPVEWDTVTPSVMVEAAGVKVGIVGLVTAHMLQVTATSNTVGLEISPLADATIREATKLRGRSVDTQLKQRVRRWRVLPATICLAGWVRGARH